MKYGGIRGTIITADANDKINITENGVIITDEAGVIQGVFELNALPPAYQSANIEDFGSRIITTSFCDMHLHAPQYPMLGLGMDLPLMQWLYNYTFRTEAMFKDTGFAREVYSVLARELIARGTTHVCAFSSVHTDASLVLMEELERAGVYGFVGKISMDRNTTDELRETTEGALSEERRFIVEALSRFGGIRPIITPRFTPSCTDELMAGLGALGAEYGLRAQSHLSENFEEIAMVRSLCPDCERYYQTYEKAGLFGKNTVMAHCVHSDDIERAAMKAAGITPLSREAGSLSGGELRMLAAQLKSWKLPVTGTMGLANAQVTAGGAELSEFDSETMESRLVPGLFACGEVLDIDGDCGGFNLQWAWSSAMLAARSMAAQMKGGMNQ